MQTHHANVVVVGAGPTGTHAALLLAEGGLNVILIDQRPKGKTGAQWINGVPEWMFAQASLEQPSHDEVFSRHPVFTLIDPTNRSRVSIREFSLIDLDMRRFGERLLERALKHKNMQVFYDTAIQGFELDQAGRPVRACAEKNTFNAALFIDASGLSAVIRKRIPALNEACAPVNRQDLCTAAQEVREIRDRHGAQQFLEKNNAVPGEALSWIGIAGGYSLMRVQVDPDFNHVGFLAGVRALPDLPSGAQLIQQFVNDNAWIGTQLFGGQRAIPLRRPYTDLVAPGVALIGDSACQVYSAHGSGVGIGLVAAKMVAETILESAHQGHDIGSLEALWPYAKRFHRHYGALLGISDAFRRFSQEFTPTEIYEFLSSGLMTPGLTLDSLLQQKLQPRFGELPGQILGALKNRHIIKKVAPLLLRLPMISLTAYFYPDAHQNEQKVREYETRMQRLVG